MIPINGVLIGLGEIDLVENDSETGTPVPNGTTHFSFGFANTSDRNRTHGHVHLGGQNCILQPGQMYALHTHTYKPLLKKTNVANDTFTEVSFFRIDTRP
jgi:hypothetical protein